jgi:DUF2934 family protein
VRGVNADPVAATGGSSASVTTRGAVLSYLAITGQQWAGRTMMDTWRTFMIVSTADHIITSITGEGFMGTYTRQARPTRAEIAQLAYGMWEANGRQDGHDVEDWLRAEQQLVHHYA